MKYKSRIFIFFILISLVPFYWFREGIPVLFWNNAFHGLFFPDVYSDARYLWDYRISTGRPMTFYFSNFFVIFLLNKFFQFININTSLIQAIILSGVIFASLIGTYFFIVRLFENRKNNERIAFYSALFYITNFFTIFFIFYRMTYYIYMLPLIPISCYFLLDAIKKNRCPNILLFSIIFTLSSFIFFNPGYGTLMLIIYILIYLFFGDFKNIKMVSISIISIILLNAFWILPSITYVQEGYRETNIRSSNDANFRTSTNSMDILSVMTLIPKKTLWWWEIKDTYWRHLYLDNPIFISIEIFLLMIIFSSMFDRNVDKSIQKIVILFIFLAILGIFLSKFGNDPLGAINRYIASLPYMRLYAGIDKFPIIVMFAYTILFGYGSNYLFEIQNKYPIRVIFGIVLVLSLFIYSFSLWSGEIVTSNITFDHVSVSTFTKIPNDYYELRDFLNNDTGDYRLLFLPLLPYDMPTFQWKYGYMGDDFRKNFFERSYFSPRAWEATFDNSTPMISKSIDDGITNKSKNFKDIAGLFNIRYVILHNDINLTNGNYQKHELVPQYKLRNLLYVNDFKYIKSFGKLELYQIPEDYQFPHVYVKRNLTNFYDIKSDINVTFKKINPIKYHVSINNATESFYLIFNEAYHSQWKVYIYDEDKLKMKYLNLFDIYYIISKPLSEDAHFIENGYANAWNIETKKIDKDKDGNFVIDIYFLPQSLFYLGLTISVITFIYIIIYLIYHRT